MHEPLDRLSLTACPATHLQTPRAQMYASTAEDAV